MSMIPIAALSALREKWKDPENRKKYYTVVLVAIVLLMVTSSILVSLYFHKRAVVEAEQKGFERGKTVLKESFDKAMAEQKADFEKIIQDTNTELTLKTQELENEKKRTEEYRVKLRTASNSLQDTIRRGAQSARTTTACSTNPSHAKRNEASWVVLGQCEQRHRQLAEDAERMNNEIKEWQIYGSAINTYRKGLAEANEKTAKAAEKIKQQ